ncbi:thioredoxin family protein [Wenyingzhuangia sp. 2_MG-2023]|nr:thioredoxin family protein [Wenyingzhuangia sp. 2_MG-2023]MDO6738653.1 thioredoxin family protein [Wenyingzhuangia sp. 2_MG-2023]
MKNFNKLLMLVVLVAGTIISCKNNAKNQDQTTTAINQDKDNHEHPPKHPDDRKGPPRGNHSPEQTKTLEEIGGYNFDDVATDFELKNVDGTMVSLSNYSDAKGYVVVFTCNECPFAKMYEDRLIALHNTYAPKGYPVIAINPNVTENNDRESFEAMQKRATDKNFPFVYLADEKHEISPKYGAVRTPHVFLLNKERKVKYIGTIDDNAKSAKDVKVKFLENAIEALENGTKPNPNFTKAIGCPVKIG